MPVSKRSKVVSLTKVKKCKLRGEAGRDAKGQWIENVRSACEEEGQHVYLVELVNQRNSLLKVVRDLIKPGKVFYGKTKVMQRALGADSTSEVVQNIHKVSRQLTGHRALLVCKLPVDKLELLLQSVQESQFARAGFVATQDVELKEGPDALSQFPHSMESHFRSLGLPTLLKEGKIILLGNFSVCKKGMPLTTEQAQILGEAGTIIFLQFSTHRLFCANSGFRGESEKHLGIKMATFRIKILAEWHGGRYQTLDDRL